MRWFPPRWWWRQRWTRTLTPSRRPTTTRTTSTRRSSTTRPTGGGTTTASSPWHPPSTGTPGGNRLATAVTMRYVFQTFSWSQTRNNFAELSSSSTKSQCAKTETLQNCKVPARPSLWALQFLCPGLKTRGGASCGRTETWDSDKRRS